MEQEKSSLAALVCKVQSLGRWRLAAQQACFPWLSRAEKVSSGVGGLAPEAGLGWGLGYSSSGHLKGSDRRALFQRKSNIRGSREIGKS